MLDRLQTQRHERALGEQELKHRKLDHKAMEKQHQREQHEFRMLQMRAMMTQNSRAAPTAMQPSVEGMAELNDTTLPFSSCPT